ncbi:phage tail protein [Ornithinibacillus bavariensis]|uniref:phage tail protein n=1 Tax=Ornithinibacillus bavariensis TaxID=545502 RepID=UPI000EEFDF80|nr:phage tail protein [Ornithinibacillus sp.]
MLDLTNGLPELNKIQEGITRNGKHSKEFGMWLVSRSAPTPSEKLIIESVPFMQGIYDFSMILGERIYENRTLTYHFEVLERDYTRRKVDRTVLENWLMKDGYAPLYDDHSPGYYYLTKCTSVDVEDASGGLTVTLIFDAYPFKVSLLEEGNDIWDTFNFELDISQPQEYTVNGSLSINLLNVGATGISPSIIASSPMAIRKGNVIYDVLQGESKSESFRLEIGENPMTITGNGTISFKWHKELI